MTDQKQHNQYLKEDMHVHHKNLIILFEKLCLLSHGTNKYYLVNSSSNRIKIQKGTLKSNGDAN